MRHPYKSLEMNSIYAQEQAAFAKMKEADHLRKRKQRRRRMVMWILRRLKTPKRAAGGTAALDVTCDMRGDGAVCHPGWVRPFMGRGYRPMQLA